MAKPPEPRTAGRARWRVQTISAGNFWRKAEFTSAAQVQSIRGSPRRAKPCGGVILHSFAPQLRLRKIPDFQRFPIILLNIEVCKLIFWRAVLRTLRVGGALTRPRGAAPRCPPGPGRGPGFLWKKAGGKNTREEEVLPPWTHLFWLGGPCGGAPSFLPGLRPMCPTPVTARPPAGRAGRGGFVDGKGSTAPKPSPRGEGGPAKPGRMRGRSIGPTGRKKESIGATG